MLTTSQAKIESRLRKIEGACEERKKRLEILNVKVSQITGDLGLKREAVSLARKCVEDSLKQKSYIEEIVSSGLTEVFGVKYTFFLEPILGPDGLIKGLKPRLKEEEGEFDDPIGSFGAAAQVIASVCLKIAILLLSSGTSKVLVMDEPLANMAPILQDRLKIFVETICEKTDLQIVMVTHLDQPFGKIYHVTKEGKGKKRSSKAYVVATVLDET